MSLRFAPIFVLTLALGAGGCSVTRPVPVTPDPTSLRVYLEQHPVSNLRVTDRSGQRFWVHAPAVRGDSLIGRKGYNLPPRAVGVPFTDVIDLRTGHFSLARTGALTAGVLAAAFVTLGLLVEDAQPLD